MRITVSVEPDIDELARVGLLGSNCTIWAIRLFDQSVVLQSQVITPLVGKAVHNDGAMQPKQGRAAQAVQLSRAGLSTTPKDFLESRPRVQQQAN